MSWLHKARACKGGFEKHCVIQYCTVQSWTVLTKWKRLFSKRAKSSIAVQLFGTKIWKSRKMVAAQERCPEPRIFNTFR